MGTPIPSRAAESIRVSNECKTYFLSPEEIDALLPAQKIPPSHKKPIVLSHRDQKKVAAYQQAKKAKLDKDQYLSIRAAGKSQAECIKKLGITESSLTSYWFKKWDLQGRGVEEQAVAQYISDHDNT